MDKIKNIMLIGVGNIGIRHLQALLKLKCSYNLMIVDPSSKSLSKAKEIVLNERSINGNNNVLFFENHINSTENEIDILIIATNSDVRASVIKEVTKTLNVKYMILEKVLFNKRLDYYEISDLIQKKSIKTWVNCSNRVYQGFTDLKEELKGEPFTLKVTGSSWGLACNSIHFLDLVLYLSDSNTYTVDIEKNELESVISSKREGFYEFLGTLRGRIGNNKFEFECNDKSEELIITIESSSKQYIINEVLGTIRIKSKSDQSKEEVRHFEVPYTSETTFLLVQDIFQKQKCGLPYYAESMKLHLPMIDHFLKRLNSEFNEESNICNIT